MLPADWGTGHALATMWAVLAVVAAFGGILHFRRFWQRVQLIADMKATRSYVLAPAVVVRAQRCVLDESFRTFCKAALFAVAAVRFREAVDTPPAATWHDYAATALTAAIILALSYWSVLAQRNDRAFTASIRPRGGVPRLADREQEWLEHRKLDGG